MKMADIILSNLLGSIAEIISDPTKLAVNPGKDFTRRRKLDANNLIRMLLTMEADSTNQEIHRYFNFQGDSPTKAAFYKQRGKLNPEALPEICRIFNSKLPIKQYKGKYRLMACDGSGANIFRNPDDPDTYYPPSGRSKEGVNLIHINALYSILDRRIENLIVQPGRKHNEFSAFCQMVDVYGNNNTPAIFLCDRGYASYNDYAHVIENSHFFLIRCRDNNLERILGKPIDNLREMEGRFDRILTRSQSKKKRSRPEQDDCYRFVCQEVPFDYIDQSHPEYDINLRIVRFELSSGIYENIITNLPEDEFDFEDFLELYFLRWGEENCFRDLKYPLALNQFHSKKYAYIVQEIWARVILHNFSSAIFSGISIHKFDTKHEYQLNFSEAFKICREFLRNRDPSKIIDVEGLIANHTEAIRPGRTYKRQLRFNLPFSFCYRN